MTYLNVSLRCDIARFISMTAIQFISLNVININLAIIIAVYGGFFEKY